MILSRTIIFCMKRRIREKSWKPSKYRSPWPKVDYAWVDGSVPKKGSRAAPRPRAKWYRLRGWESWTRGWTTLSRFPPHSRGSPSTPWTFLLPRPDRKIHDLERPLQTSSTVSPRSLNTTKISALRVLLSTLAPAFFPSSEYRSFNGHTSKTSGFVQLPLRFRNAGFSNRSVWLTHRRFLSNCHCKFSREMSRASRRRSMGFFSLLSFRQVLVADCFPFFRDLRSKHVETRSNLDWSTYVKGKNPLVSQVLFSLHQFFPVQTYRSNLFEHLQFTSKSKIKLSIVDTWRIPISQFLVSIKLHNDQIPEQLFEHLKQLSSQTSSNCQLLDKILRVKFASNSNCQPFDTSNAPCQPVFRTNLFESCFLDTRNYSYLVNSPYPVSRPDPGHALHWESIRHQLWSTRGDPKKRSGRVRRGSQSWIVCRSRCRLDVQAAKACSIGGTTQASSGSRGVVCDSSSLFDHPACSRLGRLSTRGWRIHHVVLLAK